MRVYIYLYVYIWANLVNVWSYEMRPLSRESINLPQKSLIFCRLLSYTLEVVIWKGEFLNKAESYLGMEFKQFENIYGFKFLNGLGEVQFKCDQLDNLSLFRLFCCVVISLNLEDHVSEKKIRRNKSSVLVFLAQFDCTNP